MENPYVFTYTPYDPIGMADVNGDGAVDVDDLNAVVNIMLRIQSPYQGDRNGDGVVDIDDLNLVINVMLRRY